jgi:hypothetical protein
LFFCLLDRLELLLARPSVIPDAQKEGKRKYERMRCTYDSQHAAVLALGSNRLLLLSLVAAMPAAASKPTQASQLSSIDYSTVYTPLCAFQGDLTSSRLLSTLACLLFLSHGKGNVPMSGHY